MHSLIPKKLKEPIAWHGPIVMNTQEQIYDTFMEMRMGEFPPKRVNWDYKEWSSRPDGWEGTPPSCAKEEETTA